MACVNITTNAQGIPYLPTSNVQVTTTAVNLALGYRNIQPVGYFTVRLTDAIPDGTAGTLPINITLNGNTRPLTFLGGAAVTAADLTGTGVLLIFNDKFNGILQLILSAPSAAATSNG